MTVTMDATFDGKAIVTDEPLGLPANTRVRVTVAGPISENGNPMSFIETALSMNLDGPEDWSENFEQYLAAERASTHD
jgi:hypothetical protein